MIKYNDNTINKWYHDGELIKVYYHDAVCYYKLTPSGQTPCFAVVTDISQYQDTEFVDVFNQADGKWYKLNNLNQYEEYGVYDSSTATTYYEGKLTVDNGYEYQYSGSSWVNVGAVTNKSYRYWMWRSVGKIVGSPSNYIQFSEFDLSVNGSDVSLSYISAAPTGVTNETADKLFDNSTSTKYCANFSSYLTTNYVLFDSTTAITPTSFSMTTANDSRNTGRYPKDWVLLGSNTSTTNWNDGSWDTVLSGTCGNEMKVNYKRFNYPISGLEEYPIYYDEIQDPPNNLSFSSMTEAESYECPWVGMHAIIDGDRYVFSGDSQSGYEWVYNPSRLPQGYTEVEYIENNSLAYIDTGFKPNQDTRIIAEMQCVTSTNYNQHFGCGQWDNYNGIRVGYEVGITGTLHVKYGTKNGWTVYSNITGDLNKHTYDWNKNEFYVNNTLIGSVAYDNFQTTDNLGIFFVIEGNVEPSSEGVLEGRVYSFKIYDDGTLVRDLVPCIDPNNVVGMYDIFGGVFYSSANGDTFVAGPTV